MKIVQLCPYAMARPGGVQRHVRDLSAWLEANGHPTRIVAPPNPGTAPRRRGNLFEAGRARSLGAHGTAFELSRARLAEATALAAELREWGADLAHMHTPWTPMLVGQIWRRLRLPTVTTIHATLPDAAGTCLVDRYIRWSARRFLKASDAVVVPSQAPLPMLRGLAPGLDAHVLPPAVDLSPWRDAPRVRGPGLSLTFLGRLEPRKGVDILLDAWPRIARALPQAVLTVAGDGALRASVEAQTGPRLRYAGRPDDAGARALLAATDLFLAPAPYGESYGLVLAEAMAAGAVPVAAANPGYGSVLAGGGEDLLVPPANPQALADRVIQLAADRDRLNRLRHWAEGHAMQSDLNHAGPRYEHLFASIRDACQSPPKIRL